MKIKLALIALASVVICQFSVAQTNKAAYTPLPPAVQAQLEAAATSNPPPTMPPLPTADAVASNIVANLPTVPLANETVGVTFGSVMEGAASQFNNIETIDYSFGNNFFVGAQIINSGSAGSVLESAGARLGFFKPFSTARLYGYVGGERNWSKNNYDGFAGLGLAYTPFGSQTNSIVQNFSLAIEEQIVIDPSDLKSQPPQRTITGVRYSF